MKVNKIEMKINKIEMKISLRASEAIDLAQKLIYAADEAEDHQTKQMITILGKIGDKTESNIILILPDKKEEENTE